MQVISAFRKHESDYKKRLKKQKIEKLTQSQKGDMDKFVIKKPQVSSGNQLLHEKHAHEKMLTMILALEMSRQRYNQE